MATKIFGRVHSIESLSCIDGRGGPRYMVFLQGCLMRCKICSNPDTWKLNDGRLLSSEELVERIGHYRPFLKPNGGVTISGGEPLLQPRFVKDVFRKIHAKYGLSTCIDTAGYSPEENMDMVLPDVDHILFCIKHPDPKKYYKFTGKSNVPSIKFLSKMKEYKKSFSIRYVIVPGITDDIQSIDDLIRIVKNNPTCQDVELLPYHTLGKHKWEQMHIKYPYPNMDPPSTEQVLHIKEYIEQHDIKVIL